MKASPAMSADRPASVAMVFGRKQEASDEGIGPLREVQPPLPPEDGLFRQVTDVAWDSAGNTYISDGYINSRIAKVDKGGNWLKSWGEPGNKPGQFDTPHSIAVDAQDNVYVADRGNHRIQVSIEMVNSFARSLSMFPSRPMHDPRLATKQIIHLVRERQVLLGRFASPRRQIRCCSVLMHFQGESTSLRWMGRF
jgi:hypothetical protein